MGAREEVLPTRYLFGYAGPMRPLQVVGGNCPECGLEVWIDCPRVSQQQYLATVHVHFSCENKKKHRSEVKRVRTKRKGAK